MTKAKISLTIIFLLVFANITIIGQNISDSGNEAVSLEISTDKVCYDLQEDIEVSLKFRNVGNTPVYFYKQGKNNYPAGLETLIYNPEGKLLFNEDPICFSPFLKPNPEDFISLKPNKIIKRETTHSLTEGVYFLRGYYQSHISNKSIPDTLKGERIWTIQDNDIYSPKIKIKIAAKCSE